MRLEPSLAEVQRAGVPPVLTDEPARALGLLVAFTGREGGASRGPYASLNLAARVGDAPEAVAENRRRAAAAAGFDGSALALARQVHGTEARAVPPGTAGVFAEADILTVAERGPVAAILTADCAPVVVAGTDALAVIHAGWRGLVSGVIEQGVAEVGRPLAAWVGPSIRSCCYEVGPEVAERFDRLELSSGAPGRVDTTAAATTLLERSGVPHVAASGRCTYCDARYFSYRRDGTTGRQGVFAAWVGDPGSFAEAAG
ncbi:MAG: polyphenol oxidase family protein [Actinomycetota bacterium]